MNNRERQLWLENDEGLYNWWKRSKQSKVKFIKDNKEELDRVIDNVLNGKKPAHYLVYGG